MNNKNNGMNLGVVQGRLIQSPPGELQWFPQENWMSEFFLAAEVGLDYIELIAERTHNPNNPIWSENGVAKIRQLTQENRLQLYALCNDYIIDNDLLQDEVVEQNLNLLDISATLGCVKYILPLFEKSELTRKSFDKYRESLSAIADKAADLGMVVCLETILTGNELLHVLDSMGHSALAVVYDTGNRVAFGHDLPGDIRLLNDVIKHVHIKDKNAENENVLLGTGLVNFHDVFLALADIDYHGNFTFETQRGSNPVNTARYNINLVNFFISEGFAV